MSYTFFFYKKTVYKNIQAEIPEKIRTSVRTSQPRIMARKRIPTYFVIFVTKFNDILLSFINTVIKIDDDKVDNQYNSLLNNFYI